MPEPTTLQEITEQIAQLQRQAELLRAQHKQAAIDAIVQAMVQYKITYEELRSAASGVGGRPKMRRLPPKYRNPKTGETWSGRGRTARWILQAEREGKSRDKFLIR
jgi:DNA-binding protein H-NS